MSNLKYFKLTVFFIISAQLSDWNLIFYGTETAPGYELETVTPKKKEGVDSGSLNEDNTGEINSGSRWKEIAQRTGQTSQEVVRHMPEVSSGCHKPANSCLGLSLVLIVILITFRNTISEHRVTRT